MEAEEARRDRRAVAGYDLVFTPVKSVSLLWALGSAGTREQVEAAHHEAVAGTLVWLERVTAFARIGDAGQAQIETRGFLATAFDHRDSRAGDPDLHTHVAISNQRPGPSSRVGTSLAHMVLRCALSVLSPEHGSVIDRTLGR